ncbi:MAG: PilW family protein [Bacillota bacterium]|uniref:PilW family protein n=1 Tax=Desulfurispora thermophila TaxID=265470 RepID=UPI00036C52FD|nr:prepilin-type N-terminal cleavage/methylation domain-containing protein [Desulfurispora thermophila]
MRKKRQSAFTLVEVVIAMLVFTLVMGAAMLIYQHSLQSWSRTDSATTVQESLRLALDRMTRELRTATSIEKATVENGKTIISFQTYISENNQLKLKTITYHHDPVSQQIYRAVGTGSPNPLADNIAVLDLYYYDTAQSLLGKNNVSTRDLNKINLIRITIQGERGRRGQLNYTGPLSLSSSVALRASSR